jgi:O-antigen ligase
MFYRYYSNAVSQASKTAALWFVVVGLMLIGFGMLVWVLKEIFALLAAALFFVFGFFCGVTGIKIYLAQRQLDKMNRGEFESYRKNVRIHREEDIDI